MPRTSTTLGPGTQLALKHGGHRSLESLAPRTTEILAELEAGVPLLLPVDGVGLRLTAAAIARFEEINAWLEGEGRDGKKRGAIDSRGRPRAAMKLFYTAYREVHRGLAAHGATAMARAMMAPGMAEARRRVEAEEAQLRMRARMGQKAPRSAR